MAKLSLLIKNTCRGQQCRRRCGHPHFILITTICIVLILLMLLDQVTHVNSYHLNSLNSLVDEEAEQPQQQQQGQTPSSVQSLKSLQSKLDLILDTESREKKLLESLLFESERNENKQVQERQKVSSLSLSSSLPPPTSSLDSIVQKLVENSARMESMIGMLSDFKTILSQTITTQEKQLGYKTEVVELREEVGYLREEIQKIKSQQARASDVANGVGGGDGGGIGSRYKNKIHNDEITINWLKDNVKELRHEIVEVSSSLNVTGLLHLQQQLRLHQKSATRDVQGIQGQLSGLQLNSDQVNEQLLEIRADVADLRTWQTKMGARLMSDDGHHSLSTNSIEPIQLQVQESRLKLLQESLEASTEEILKKNNNRNAAARRHSKKKFKLKHELHRVEKILLEMVRDQNALVQKVNQLEMSKQQQRQQQHERAIWKKVVQSRQSESGNHGNDNGDGDDGLITITYTAEEDNMNVKTNDGNESNEESEQGRNEITTASGTGRRRRRRHEVYDDDDGGHGLPLTTTIQSRVSALEKSLGEYSNNLDIMDNKVAGLVELHTTMNSLFTSLETIENKYDVKITDLQTTIAKVEAGLSSVQVATDELKDQQNQQHQLSQSCKKETRALGQTLQTTQLRMASLQNQILKWGMKLCESSNYETIQDLKIASASTSLSSSPWTELV